MGWFSAPRSTRPASAARRFRLSRIERTTLFREMVKGELGYRDFSSRRYGQLIAYAGRLGIEPVEAAELIVEARAVVGLPIASTSRVPWISRTGEALRSGPLWLTVSLLALAFALINLLLFRVL